MEFEQFQFQTKGKEKFVASRKQTLPNLEPSVFGIFLEKAKIGTVSFSWNYNYDFKYIH